MRDARKSAEEGGEMIARNTILCGDALTVLRTLPAESVHCVVTSPPYWGLRDYGTASWEGGDEGCDHARPFDTKSQLTSGLNLAKNFSEAQSNVGHRHEGYKHVCGKCGAKRVDSQLGLESTVDEYVDNMVAVFREVRRVLRDDGTVWLNLGDSYASGANPPGEDKTRSSTLQGGKATQASSRRAPIPCGLKPKDLIGVPWRVAFALQADGWWLRSDIIWSKPNPMPESVTDRPTRAHEYVFLLSKKATYYYDAEAIREPAFYGRSTGGFRGEGGYTNNQSFDNTPHVKGNTQGHTHEGGRNKRTVWEIATEPYAEAHFATFPTALVKPCILAGTSEHGCCAVCGAPWRRVVEMTDEYRTLLDSGKAWRDTSGKPNEFTNRQPKDHPSTVPQKNRTTGWAPTCTHEAPLVPALVLDPFFGSGTTGLVAARAGRDWLGIELNPAYVEMAERRLMAVRDRLL